MRSGTEINCRPQNINMMKKDTKCYGRLEKHRQNRTCASKQPQHGTLK